MESTIKRAIMPNPVTLQSEGLCEYILNTAVYPHEANPLKELRKVTACHPICGTADGNANEACACEKTIEVGVFTGYSLLLTALTIPDDGHITAIDINRETFEIGFPIMQKAGVAHKINFIESQALPVLDKVLEDKEHEGSFDFAFMDADKGNYLGYHERLMKLVKVGGIILYDNTLWEGAVALPESSVPEPKWRGRNSSIEFNKVVSADQRVDISLAPLGDGISDLPPIMLKCKDETFGKLIY